MPHLVKVGVTDDLDKRLCDLNKTSIPTRFQVYESFDQLKNAEILEQEILRSFATKRINKKREFIEEHPERICDFVREHRHITEEKIKVGLFKLGIKKGGILKFTDGEKIYPDIQAVVESERHVMYLGKKQSLSSSAKLVLNEQFEKKWKSARGTVFWTYRGKTIAELRDGMSA